MSKRILYVEDNFNNVLLFQRIVQAEGHEVFIAGEADSGWQLAVELQPDLIVVDLRLPGDQDGFDLIRRLRATAEVRRTPIVVLTAYGNEEAEREARAAGSDDFLHKPAGIEQVRQMLRKHLGPSARAPFVPNRLSYQLASRA